MLPGRRDARQALAREVGAGSGRFVPPQGLGFAKEDDFQRALARKRPNESGGAASPRAGASDEGLDRFCKASSEAAASMTAVDRVRARVKQAVQERAAHEAVAGAHLLSACCSPYTGP